MEPRKPPRTEDNLLVPKRLKYKRECTFVEFRCRSPCINLTGIPGKEKKKVEGKKYLRTKRVKFIVL